MGSLVGVDLNTTLAMRQERRAQSSPKGSVSHRSKSPAVSARGARSGPPSSRGGAATDRSDKSRGPPRFDQSFSEARANVQARVDAGLPTTPELPARPKITTPSSAGRQAYASATKSQQSRIALKAGSVHGHPPPRSKSAPRRVQSAGSIPAAAKLPSPQSRARHAEETASSAQTKLAQIPVSETGLLEAGDQPKGVRHFSLTASPTGRFSANSYERTMLRSLDPYTNIDYIAAGAPDNDRNMKEASWLASQAFVESLRSYPQSSYSYGGSRSGSPTKKSNGPREVMTMALMDEGTNGSHLFSRYTFSGNTYSSDSPPQEHIETAVRRRCGIATSDAEWRMTQLPRVWSHTRTMTNHDWGPFEIVPAPRPPDRVPTGHK